MTYDVSDDLTLFTSWGEGFKSGGFNNSGSRATIDTFINPLNPGSPVAVTDVYEKETNDSLEVGFKASLLEIESALKVLTSTQMQMIFSFNCLDHLDS